MTTNGSSPQRAAILAAAVARKCEEIHVPEWKDESGDDTFYVAVLTAGERFRIERGAVKSEIEGSTIVRKISDRNTEVMLVGMTLLGRDKQRLFSDSEIDVLESQPSDLIKRVAAVAMRVNRMTADAVEEAEKNSSPSQNSDSSSGSPRNLDAPSPN